MLDAFHQARRTGAVDAIKQYFDADAVEYSPGGTTLMLARRLQRPPSRPTSTLIRHVKFLTPDSAVAIALWRSAEAKTPEETGIRDIFMVRKDGTWKIVGMRSAFVQSPAAAAPRTEGRDPSQESLTAEERAAGWQSLFDGKTMDGWVTMTGKAVLPPSWRIADGCLVTAPIPMVMALRTRREYREFELAFEWMVSAKGNSGVKYRLFAAELWANGEGGDAAGFEYQIADDEGDPGAIKDPRQKSGALYGVTPVSRPAARPPGSWNQSRIIVGKATAEHWLNGEKVAETPIDVPFASPITLQHHNSEVRFRNLKIRE